MTISNQALLQFIKGKSRDSRKLLRYLSEIVTSVFKGDIGGCGCCGGLDPSGFGGASSSHAGLASIFTIIFVLYLNDLPSEALLSLLISMMS